MTKSEMLHEMLDNLNLPHKNFSIKERIRKCSKTRIEKVYNWYLNSSKDHDAQVTCLYLL